VGAFIEGDGRYRPPGFVGQVRYLRGHFSLPQKPNSVERSSGRRSRSPSLDAMPARPDSFQKFRRGLARISVENFISKFHHRYAGTSGAKGVLRPRQHR
jgi:hypothetical protein